MKKTSQKKNATLVRTARLNISEEQPQYALYTILQIHFKSAEHFTNSTFSLCAIQK